MASLDQKRRRRDRRELRRGERVAASAVPRQVGARREAGRGGEQLRVPAARRARAPRGTARGPTSRGPAARARSARFVHVITGTIALNGTPAVVAFHTAPPPSEMPSAPICVSEISGRAVSHVKSSRRVLHVARPVEPEQPLRRAVAARVALERRVAGGARNWVASGSMSWWLAAEPVEEHHRRPAAGRGVPSGSTSEQASFAPSDAGIVSCCGVALRAPTPPRASAASERREQDDPATHDGRQGIPALRSPPWIRGPSASSTRVWAG